MVTKEKYDKISPFLQCKALALWRHENKVHIERKEEEQNMIQYGYSIANWYCRQDENLNVYFIFNDTFQILTNNIPSLAKSHPHLFGTGNADDVITAIYTNCKTQESKKDFTNRLKYFACCYIVYETDRGIDENVIKIDLFRDILNNKEDATKYDFIGGLLHSLKHFSVDGQNLATGHDINNVEDVEEVLIMASHAFLDRKQDVKKKTNYISYYETQTKRIKFVFYKEDTTNVFFLRTCHIDKR